MAVSIITGSRKTDGVDSSLIKRDVYEAIFNFDPYQTPITQFFMASKQAKVSTGNPKFELQEDVLIPHTFTAEALAGGGNTEDDVVVSDDQVAVLNTMCFNTANETNMIQMRQQLILW